MARVSKRVAGNWWWFPDGKPRDFKEPAADTPNKDRTFRILVSPMDSTEITAEQQAAMSAVVAAIQDREDAGKEATSEATTARVTETMLAALRKHIHAVEGYGADVSDVEEKNIGGLVPDENGILWPTTAEAFIACCTTGDKPDLDLLAQTYEALQNHSKLSKRAIKN